MPITFEQAKQNWIEAAETYSEAIKTYESVLSLLENAHEELTEAWEDFNREQKIEINKLKSDNVVSISKNKEK
jgi:hypothetical protein